MKDQGRSRISRDWREGQDDPRVTAGGEYRRRARSASYVTDKARFGAHSIVSPTWATVSGSSITSGPSPGAQSSTTAGSRNLVKANEIIDRGAVWGDADRYESSLLKQTSQRWPELARDGSPHRSQAVAEERAPVGTLHSRMACPDTMGGRDAPSVWLQYHLGQIPASAYRGLPNRPRHGSNDSQQRNTGTPGLLRSQSTLDMRQKTSGRRHQTKVRDANNTFVKFDDLWWVSRNSPKGAAGKGAGSPSSLPVRVPNGGSHNSLGLTFHAVSPSHAPSQRPSSSSSTGRTRSANHRLLGTNRSQFPMANPQYCTANGLTGRQNQGKYPDGGRFPENNSEEQPNVTLAGLAKAASFETAQAPKANLITLDIYPGGYRARKPGSASGRKPIHKDGSADDDVRFNTTNDVQYVVSDEGRIVKLGDTRDPMTANTTTDSGSEQKKQPGAESSDGSRTTAVPTGTEGHDPQTVLSRENGVQNSNNPGDVAEDKPGRVTMDRAIAAVNPAALAAAVDTVVNQQQSQSVVDVPYTASPAAADRLRMANLTWSDYFSMEVTKQQQDLQNPEDGSDQLQDHDGSKEMIGAPPDDVHESRDRPASSRVKNRRSVRFSITNQVREYEPGEPIDSDSVGDEADGV